MASLQEQIKNYSDERLITTIKQSYHYDEQIIDFTVAEIKARNLKTGVEINEIIEQSVKEREAKPRNALYMFDGSQTSPQTIWLFITGGIIAICVVVYILTGWTIILAIGATLWFAGVSAKGRR